VVESHDTPADPFQVSFPGPFQHHDVVVDGWRVPFLEAQLDGEDRVTVTLDRRISVDLSTGEAERLLPFLADSIAVALGYGSHPGEDTAQPLQRLAYPRPRRVSGLVAAS
jgi:hypothetical protein